MVQARVRYYDGVEQRPGLPTRRRGPWWSSIDPKATVVTLINLSGTEAHRIVLQAGVPGNEDDIETVAYTTAAPGWTGTPR